MAFVKVNKKVVSKKDRKGIVYILIMVVDGYEIYKIGVTERKNVLDRVLEIAGSHFNQYRYVPYIKAKRFRTTDDIYTKEKILHDYFRECKYTPEKKHQGYTEQFQIDDQEHLLEVYEKVLKGEDIGDKYVPQSTETTEG